MTTIQLKERGKILNIKIKDAYFIKDVIDSYMDGDFQGMANLIIEFGEYEFFPQLFELLESQTWRKITNKYLTFVGITIEFQKYKEGYWLKKTNLI